MKKDVTYVDAAKFEQLILKHGLTAVAQAGFVRVDAAKGRRVYVANTKRVGRVDISGFEMEGPGIVGLKGEAFGAVKQRLDFSLPEAEILAGFERVLEHMKSLPAVEPKAKSRTPKAAGPKPQGWSGTIKEATPEEKEAARTKRAALIAETAKRLGAKVSKKAGLAEGAPQPQGG